MVAILQAWSRVAPRKRMEAIPPAALEQLLVETSAPLLVALSEKLSSEPSLASLIERLEIQDPRIVQTISVISLFEKQQERLPPALLADSGLSYDKLPEPLSLVQAQLKRCRPLGCCNSASSCCLLWRGAGLFG